MNTSARFEKHIYYPQLWPHHEKTRWGSNLNAVTVYLQLSASLKIMIFSGVQTCILYDKIWKEHILSSALGPTKNILFLVWFNLEYILTKYERKIFYILYLYSTLGQTWILFNKIWREHVLSSSLDPTIVSGAQNFECFGKI